MQDRLYQLKGLLPAVYNRIIDGIEPAVSGTITLQVLGIYHLILYLYGEGQTPTSVAISQRANISTVQVNKLAKELLTLGLVTREQVHASHGRGRLWAYYPLYDIDELRKVLGAPLPHRPSGTKPEST